MKNAPLQAWCIVPYDSAQRSPSERAAMLRKLGIKRLAYDWRYKDLDHMDLEVAALRGEGLEMSALWALSQSDAAATDAHLAIIFDFVARNELGIPLWVTLMAPPDYDIWGASKRLAHTVEAMAEMADRAADVGCSVALYNHGGWFGEPASQAAIVKEAARANLGIVYNFRHGHAHIADFADHAAAMLPYLHAVNLNGMRVGGPKTLPFGSGDHEFDMLLTLLRGGYAGPLGLINHQETVDAEQALRLNLNGLARLKRWLKDA
ncbi:sugar phosphate isomerase/epimerase family protein [Sphingopyxis sp. PET50]|uniref:sugar phosphate isomerase/epimerase family protein n=1 Tax=Sphingopyxis sp. PET50 TaxID=2976533 RepID=UPI0021B06145|nr:sugar phosphate isomerase/epimerase [Sphingopyxis sp. PET50]